MQKWEYLGVIRNRNIEYEYKGLSTNYKNIRVGKWENLISRLGQELEISEEGITTIMNKLGDEGWELISSTAISTEFDIGTTPGHLTPTDNRAGFTNQIWLYFKRPKE